MFGVFVGALLLLGIVWMARRRHRRHAWHHPRRHRWEARWLLEGVFRRLETSPGQERVLTQAAERVQDVAREVRSALRDGAEAAARALRAEQLDPAALEAARVRQDEATAALRTAVQDALTAAHEALDARQRAALADLLEHGGAWHRHGGRPRWA